MAPRAAVAHADNALGRPALTGRQRVVIEHLQPEVDAGRFPIKRTPGERVTVTVDVFADGHELLAGVLKCRRISHPEEPWRERLLTPIDNDSWTASFFVEEIGRYEYTVEAWIDRWGSWLKALTAKADAGQDVASELLEGSELVHVAVQRTVERGLSSLDSARLERGEGSRSLGGPDTVRPTRDEDLHLLEIADLLRSDRPQRERIAIAREPGLTRLMQARADRHESTSYERTLEVIVDPERSRFSAWYEMFPRSCTPDPSRGGTFADAEHRLPDIAAMGFDVVYLPPIHPIGRSFRKGRNNSLTSTPDDPGSPWAIGGPEGGHTAIEPGLGTIDDFDRFVTAARNLGLHVALDIAFQASPDHPWVREHPEWFRHRPDGSIKYAENPPKKYQDIYPLDFESEDWRALWNALAQVFLFWASHGVTIFRVDNPHTKAFGFWEWCIAEVKRSYPQAIFLSEAFTRPKVMRYLAKAGFTQSYTYFTWRNSAQDLREYLTELTTTDVREYMRPNLFANTPDILHEYLQTGGRPAFEVRLVLAATLAASYGIYSGFELCERVAVHPGSEEYLDSEKYQIKIRDWNAPGNLRELIARVNAIRRDYPALQFNDGLRFHATDNPALLSYSKTTPDWRRPTILDPRATTDGQRRPTNHQPVFVVANTDPHHVQHGWVEMPLIERGVADDRSYIVEDLLDGTRYTWRGAWNYVRLDPGIRMAHIFVIRDF